MVLSFKVGTFTKIGTVSTQSITGVGFQPKGLLLFGTNDETMNAFQADHVAYHGLASSTSKQRTMGIYEFDATAADQVAGWRTDAILCDVVAGSFDQVGVLSALGSDGFSINWTTNSSFNYNYGYVAIAGADVTNVDVGSFTAPNATGNFAVTGVGFKPDCIILLGVHNTSDNVSVGDTSGYSLGFANISLEQAVTSCVALDTSTSDTARYQRTTKCLAMFSNTSSTTLSHEATIVSMDTDGFTLNFSTAASANRRVAYMACKGGKYKIGSFNTPTAGTAPIAQSVTGVGFQPRGVLFATAGNITSSSIATHCRCHVGAANSSTSEFSMWNASQDAVASSSVTACRGDNNACIRVSDEATSHGSSTTQALADFTSMTANGFDLSYSVKDASNAYEVIYVAFGDAGTLFERAVVASVTITANVARKKKVPRTLNESSIIITADVVRIKKTFKTASETVIISALVTTAHRVPRTVSESFTVVGNGARMLRANKGVAASLTIVDSVLRIFKIGRSVTEAFLINASISVGELFLRQISDSFTIADSVVRFYRANKLVTATLTIGDVVTRKIIQVRAQLESIVVSAIGNRTAKIRRSLTESFTIAAGATGNRLTHHFRSVVESLAITEDGVVEFCTTAGQLPELIRHKLGRYFSILPQRNIRAYVYDSVFFKRKERET